MKDRDIACYIVMYMFHSLNTCDIINTVYNVMNTHAHKQTHKHTLTIGTECPRIQWYGQRIKKMAVQYNINHKLKDSYVL